MTCKRSRGSACLVLVLVFLVAMPTLAVVPPQDPAVPIPSVVLDAVRDGRTSAFQAANPLAGVVPANVAARQSAGTLSLTSLAGDFDYPVLPGRYLDTVSDPWPVMDLENQLFEPGYTGLGRPGSLRDYFNETSYSNYAVGGTVFDWTTVAQNGSYYAGATGCNGLCSSTTESAAGLVEELIGLNDTTVDFSLYDNDGPDGIPNSGDDDGVVDLLVVVQPLEGGECGNGNIWSHLGRYTQTFGASRNTNDAAAGGGNILIEDYIVVPAFDCDGSSLITIGTFAHLFGLHLGLPPLWDRDGTSRGVGTWDVMSRGNWGGDGSSPERPVHPGAYSKALLGWTIPQIIVGNESGASLPAVESTSHAREFSRPDACTHQEYFLVENRQPTGFDLLLPGNGLLIWHADDNASHSDEEAHLRAALVQADARYGLENNRNDGDMGDPWPGSLSRVSWRDNTDPSSSRWHNRPSGATINGISLSGDPMTADLTQLVDPILHITSATFDDGLPGLGDGDGAIDPYETVRITVALSNEGQTQATGISGTLSLVPAVSGVTITDASSSWPDFDSCGTSSTADFEISLDENVSCETELNFQLDLTYGEGTDSLTFQLMVGKLFTADATQLTSTGDEAGSARIASTGSVAGVIYHEDSAGRDVVRMVRMDTGGVLLTTTDISAGTGGDAQHPDVAWNGTEYGATWDDDRDGTTEIYFARIDSAGVRIGAELRLTSNSGDSTHPRIAWNDVDSEWGITWSDTRNGTDDVLFARVSNSGTKAGSDVSIATGAGDERFPDIVWSGTRFGIAWQDDTSGEWSLYFTSTDSAGTPQIANQRLEDLIGDSIHPAISYNATSLTFGIAFLDYKDGKTRSVVKSARIDQDAITPAQVKTISEGMARAECVDLDSDGTSFFASWVDHRDGSREVRVTRTDDRFNVQLDAISVDQEASHSTITGIDFGNGQLFTAWLKEDSTSHRTTVFARGMNPYFECGRDDDGDGVIQPGDNCPSTANPDQLDDDSDTWGNACDCDDVDPNVNPGQIETICDNIDNDCSAATVDAPDVDADGVDLCDVSDVNNPDGVGVDCDDNDPLNYPTNTEVCDGQDNDCDSTIDEDFPVLTWYRDADGDTYGDPALPFDTCEGNHQGHVADNTDCDDSRADVNPGMVEACDDGADTDCDGTVDETTGTRYVSPAGSDTGNECIDSGSPCLNFNHAILVACDGETVLAAEGTYTQDVVVDHPVTVDNQGLATNTIITGTGTGDVVKILSNDVTWDGVNAANSPGHACFRIGDSLHTGLRGINLRNTSAKNCGVGIVVDSTGVTGDWNRILSMDIQSQVTDGSAGSGIGVLYTGGNGRIELKTGWIRFNEGAGIRVEAPPQGETNQTVIFVGNRIQDNGSDSSADSEHGLEVYDASDVRIEGNRIYDNAGFDANATGRAVVLDGVNGGNFFCNRMETNDNGLLLTGGTTAIGILHNNFEGQAGTAIRIDPAAGSATLVNENKIHSNATGLDHAGDGTLDARHNWWGTDDGPGGSGGGTGDPVTGSLDISNFVARTIAPILTRRPSDSGWSESVASCRQKVQTALNNATPGDLILVGAGVYKEHITMGIAVDIEGISGGAGCSPAEIEGRQSGGTHLPAMRITDVDGGTLTSLTIRSSGEGTICGSASGDEIGLDLQNVDNSTFTNLCLKENGVTELRLYGDSDSNTFDNLVIDGMIRLGGGEDVCGHRSREGILIDGGPACEGGPGASADNNTFSNMEVNYNARSVVVRLASNTLISDSTITASPAPAWDGGALALGVLVEMADDTTLDNNIIGAGEETEAVRIMGRDAASCVTEWTDANNTTVSNNEISDATSAGIHMLKSGGDPGSPVNVQLDCNDIHSNVMGVLADYVGPSPSSAMHTNNLRLNTDGVRNNGIHTLDATGNYWNASDGPSGSGPGSGDSVLGATSYGPWLNNNTWVDDDADGYSECAGDCDDEANEIGPDSAETCDGIDNDCDGTIDDGLPTNTYYRDSDEDTFGDPGQTVEDCSETPPTGFVTDNTDCDDTLDTVYPGANEVVCDAIDQACDGSANEAPDNDIDGYDQCAPTDPYDGDGLDADCDDSTDTINPGVTEIACDGIDQDCAGGDLATDGDADGADICGTGDANNPDGVEADCDDADPLRAPHLAEVCDDIDNDCDSTIDEDLTLNTYYQDQDSDTYGDAANSIDDCAATPPSGFVTDSSDCDDDNPQVHPAANEVCSDNIDNDCDGSSDAADATCSVLDATNLRFQSGSKVAIDWDLATGADSYAFYKGSIPERGFRTGFGSYDHLCGGTEISITTAQATQIPPVGESFYYLASGLTVDGGTGAITAGPLGESSSGSSRPDSTTITCGPRVYVDPDAAGAGNGLAWADAYTTVSAAFGHSKATDRGLEIWVRGTVNDNSGPLLDGNTRSGGRLYGGFAGTETSLWQRDIVSNPTVLNGGGSAWVLRISNTSALVEGVTLENATAGLLAETTDHLEARNITFQQLSGKGIDLTADRAAGGSLFVYDSSFDGSSQQGVRVVSSAGILGGRIQRNSFAGSSDASIRLEARPGAFDADCQLAVIANTISGGNIGLVLGAHLADKALTATESSLVASNLIYDTTSHAVLVEASGDFSTESAAADARSVPTLVGNTLTDGGGAGIVCSATRTDSTADPSLHQVRATPQVWDNLLTYLTGAGIEESADDALANLVSDPVVIGNLLFGNGSLYTDEGTTTLPAIADLNNLSGNSDNIDSDPLYFDRPADNYVLATGSPAIDQGHANAPANAKIDVSGGARIKDGNSDGTAEADLGAHEL